MIRDPEAHQGVGTTTALMDPSTTTSNDVSAESRTASPLVDTDVHPVLGDVGDLKAYMSARCGRRAFGLGMNVISRDPNRIPHPSGGSRLDATTPDGGPPGSDPAFALEQWIEPYDITAAVLVPVQVGTVVPWGDEATGSEFLAAMNQYFLERWVGLDSRYRLAISVSPYNIPDAVKEIERLADTDGVCGVFLPHAGVDLGRSHYFPIYEIAEHHGLPIVMHPTGAEGNFSASAQLGGGLPQTYPERHSLLSNLGQSMLASAIFGGVFDRFPTLKLVLTEYGFTWVPSFTERMDRAWELGGRTLAGLSKAPSDYVRENVRFTTQPVDEPGSRDHLATALDLMPTRDILMFSSDYPHWDQDDPTLILRSKFPKSLRGRIAFETALDCFGSRLGIAR